MSLCIAVDARPLAAPLSGIGRYLSSLLVELAETDHRWRLYSHAPIDVPVSNGNVEVRTGEVARSSWSTPFAQARFAAWARDDRADVFWSPRHHLPLLLRGLPAVVTIHDLVWRRAPSTMMPMGRLLERLLMPPALRAARTILVPSAATAADLQSFYPQHAGKVRVTPLGATLRAGPPSAAAARSPYLLFVGTLEPRKNLARVLAALEQLRQRGTRLRLVIAGGRGWKSAGLHSTIDAAERAGFVEYLGHVDDTALAQLYSGCEFLVAPSLYEGFGLQIVEALNFGKPVITSRLSSMPEVAGNAGLLVDPCSVDEIRDAIATLSEDAGLRHTLAGCARRQAEKFSWKAAARATLAALESAAR